MTIFKSMPTSSWSVICKNANRTFWWLYVFNENHTVTWKDEHNGRHGSGTWSISGKALTTRWVGSATVESWDPEIDSDGWTGTCTMDNQKYDLSATMRNTGASLNTLKVGPPEGQADIMACWGASLAWWTREVAKTFPKVAVKTQAAILASAKDLWTKSGGLGMNDFMLFFPRQSSLNTNRITTGELETYLTGKPLPVIIAFASGPLGGHVNVLHSYDADSKSVVAMEPWFPDPTKDPRYHFEEADPSADSLGAFRDKDGNTNKFYGTHVTRPLSFYTSKPLDGALLIAYRSATAE